MRLNNIAMIYGNKLLFENVNLDLVSGHRYGLVGANGCGKSTLMHLLSKNEEPCEGEVNIPKSAKIGWLRQDQFLSDEERVLDVVIRGKPDLWKTLEAKNDLLSKPEFTEQDGYKLAEIEEVILKLDGYSAESFAEKILVGLGIANKYHHGPLKALSGGMKLRVLLAQALFHEPDILLLDEPTNHLDLMTISWLENYLRSEYKGLLIIISHDKDFLNNTITDILDIDYGEVRLYPNANYDKFLEQKALIVEQLQHERSGVQKKIDEMQKFVDRFKAKATKARQAQSRMKMIEKLEMPDLKQSSRIAPKFVFKQERKSGKDVLVVDNISKAYGDNILFLDVSFNIKRGEKIALIGHNGIGKSTLLKLLMNLTELDLGTIEWGYETKAAYFAQDHHDQLKDSQTVWEWINNVATGIPSSDLRNVLGRMLFKKDDVHKNILSLSGGEAARLLFANIMVSNANVLVLDEPTNHLDLETIDSLSDALNAYDGTVLVVSHNRSFVSAFANRIIAITEAGVLDYHGTYSEFCALYGLDYLSIQYLKTVE